MGIRGRLLTLALSGVVPFVVAGLIFASVRQSMYAYTLLGFAVIVCAVGAALLISRNLIRRIGILDSAAAQFAEGKFAARVPDESSDELAQLGEAFNAMAQRLETNAARFNEIDRLKSEFVSSVSHELRTPLTTIKALTRLLMRGELSDEKRREYLETISVECDRQIDLVLNLLDLSRIEGGVFRINAEKVDVAAVIASCVKSETASAEKRRHTLRIESVDTEQTVCADSKALRRVLSNLIENAIKYTPDGGLITLASRTEDDHIAISVSDNGRGIPPDDIPRLFDKFHRGRPSRDGTVSGTGSPDEDFLDDADVSGVGLGLYLARTVMNQMGGRIDVDTEVGRGSTFTLRLPVWESDLCKNQEAEDGKNAKAIAGRRR